MLASSNWGTELRTREELAWAAGFFDGEGSAGCYTWIGKKTGYQQYNLIATVSQDQRVLLERFQNAVGVGKVYGPYARPTGTREEYAWQTRSEESVQALLAMLWPWLGEYKREQLTQALLTLRSRPGYGSKGGSSRWRFHGQLDLAITDGDRRAAAQLLDVTIMPKKEGD